MKAILKPILFAFILLFTMSCAKQQEAEPKLKKNSKVEEILSTMTLKDKIGEMTQLSVDMVSKGEPYTLLEPHQLDTQKLQNVLVNYRVGSILNCGGHAYSVNHWREIIKTIQFFAQQKETKIPVLYGIDAIHGTNYTLNSTLYPQQIGQAAAWDTAMARVLGQVTAYETRASYIPWVFTPVLDIGRDPRWPRLWETFGEDPYLIGQMGVKFIEGLEGNNLNNPYQVASCLKHFLGYSQTITGKDRTPAWVGEREILQTFFPPFKQAIDAGSKTVMINSGEINGTPVHTNKKIITELLKNKGGFNGLAVTDWEDIKYLMTRHKVAKDYKEAVFLAINAGIDMAMVPMDLEYCDLLLELVNEGKISEERIDKSVRRILNVKLALGLFDQAYFEEADYSKFGGDEFKSIAKKAADESITLLKNENSLLPLDVNQKLLVIGPTANSKIALNGGWTYTWQGMEEKYYPEDVQTVKKALESAFGMENINYAKGCDVDSNLNLNGLDNLAKNADVIVACVGELGYTEKVGDLEDLNLPDVQFELVQSLKKYNKPIVLVLLQGRPRIIRKIEPLVDAILYAYYPGNEGAVAISDILVGKVNPSGKLPITYPRFANDLLTYNHKNTETIDKKFGNNAFNPQFEFGFGLSYTTFSYSNLKVNKSTFSDGDTLIVQVDVTNTGNIRGKEVVQLFYRDEVASITPPVKNLARFSKVELEPQQTKTLTFYLGVNDFSFVNKDLNRVTEPGDFTLIINQLNKKITYN